MTRIYQSPISKRVYCEDVFDDVPENIKVVRDNEIFTISTENKFKKQVKQRYSLFTDIAGNSFISADKFQEFLNSILEKRDIITMAKDVSPKDGWTVKIKDGNGIYAMLEHAFYNGAPIVNDDNMPIPETALSWPFTFQRVGTYKLTISYCGSIDSTGRDLVVIPRIGNSTIVNITNGEAERREGKDSLGNDAALRLRSRMDPL